MTCLFVEGLLVVDQRRQLFQPVAGFFLNLITQHIDDALHRLRDRIASDRLTRHQAEDFGDADFLPVFLAVKAVAFEIAFLRRQQIMPHAQHGTGADRFQTRFFQRIEGVSAHIVTRTGAGMKGVVVVRHLQRQTVGLATHALGQFRGQITRRMRQDQLVAIKARPIGTEDDLQLSILRKRTGGMHQRLLERFGKDGRLVGHDWVWLLSPPHRDGEVALRSK